MYGLNFFLFLSLCFVPLKAKELKNGILVFDDKSEAAAHTVNTIWDYVPEDSQKVAYAQADAVVERLWPYFCERYPKCDKFAKPEIVMSYSGGAGSFGMLHEGRLTQTNAIVVSWEIHDQPRDLEFVIAHEMIHYFEKHTERNELADEIYAIKRQTYYKCLDYPYPLEELKENLIDIVNAIDHIGERPYLVAADLGLPFEGDLGRVFERMIEKVVRYPNCGRLTSKFRSFRSSLEAGNYLYESNEAVTSFMKMAKRCFEKYPGNLLKQSVAGLNLQMGGPDPSTWSEYDAMISTEGNELERLKRLRNSRYQRYLELSRKLSGPQLRFYTEEDDADIKSLEILLESGRRNVDEGVDYLLVDLPTTNQIRCRSFLQAGKEPNYGPLNRFHHGECWRIWRAQRVEQRYLRQLTEPSNQETTQ